MSKTPEAARIEQREAAPTEAPEHVQETKVEAEAPKVGDKVEHKRADGETVKDVVVASGDRGTVLARKQGETQVFLPFVPKELEAREGADRQLDLFGGAFDSAAESAVKAVGLKGEDAKAALGAIEAGKSAVVAGAMGEENPEAAITAAVHAQAEAIAKDESEPAKPTLSELQKKWMEAKTRAEGAKDDKQYGEAMKEVRALETAIYDLRVGMHPQASAEQKAEVANQVEGAVELTQDSIYDQGAEAVQERIWQLEAEMQKADKAKNEVAWMATRNEYDHHRVMLPIIERVDAILQARGQVDALVAGDVAKQKLETKNALSSARGKKGYWRAGEEALKRTIKSIEDGMRAIDKGPSGDKASSEYVRLNAQRQEKQGKLKEIKSQVDAMNREMELLKTAEIVDTSGSYGEMVGETNTALVQTLRDTSAKNPDAVRNYIQQALKDKKLPESTRMTLEGFEEKLKEKAQEEAPDLTIPGTSLKIGDNVRVKRSSGEIEDGWKPQLVFTGADGERHAYLTKETPDQATGFIHKTVNVDRLAVWNEPVSEAEEEVVEPTKKPNVVLSETLKADVRRAEAVQATPTIEMPKPFQPFSKAESAMKDLIAADILQEGGDLEGLQDAYEAVLFALKQLGLTPEQEGLPPTFDGIKNAKDERGFFGKMFKRETNRVKLAKKLFQLYQQYVAEGQADMTEFKGRAIGNQARYKKQMKRGA
jgi:hypothetical protein